MIRRQLTHAIAAAIEAARRKGALAFDDLPDVVIETTASRNRGDYSSNAALMIARQSHRPPQEIAAVIADCLNPGDDIERVEVAGSGFINIFMASRWFGEAVRRVRRTGAGYGCAEIGQGRLVQVEFVSANPNSPLHIGHGRAAALGDILARLLEWTGWRVTREYYINDATNSTQMINLGRSLRARYQQALGRETPLPEDAYEGEYVTEMARNIAEREGRRYLSLPEAEAVPVFTDLALEEMLSQQRDELQRFGVAYDVWFSERSLYDSGAVAEVLEMLRSSGCAYESEGALWLRSTTFGDDKDRVLVRATGAPTYLSADAAYHRNKFARGFERIIDLWGPDHCDYAARTRAAVAAIGADPDRLEILIYQTVRLFKGGELVQISKRAGDIIPLSDVVEEVGTDAARFFFLTREADTPLDFDVDLAKKQSRENPVYTIRTAYALASDLLREAAQEGISLPEADAALALPGEEIERALVIKMADFPEEVVAAAELRQPHRIAIFAQELATIFHSFTDSCRDPGDEVRTEMAAARLALVDAARTVLANALQILGISAPEHV